MCGCWSLRSDGVGGLATDGHRWTRIRNSPLEDLLQLGRDGRGSLCRAANLRRSRPFLAGLMRAREVHRASRPKRGGGGQDWPPYTGTLDGRVRGVTTSTTPAFLFDLDGTLVDSVYQHVLAWRDALEEAGMPLSVWRIHRRIGMSGGLLANALARETNHVLTAAEVERMLRFHGEAFRRYADQVRALPGAAELIGRLAELGVPHAIATSGYAETALRSMKLLGISEKTPLVTRDQVARAKPDPDLFLAAADRLGVAVEHTVVVGDSIWDLLAARRARALGVGLLSGGYGEQELERAGAYRVYEDPADLLAHLDEVGVR
jgi:HAD superfamily hydrolase (TIGR01549 family)